MKESANKNIQLKVNTVIEQIELFKRKMERIEREAETRFQREYDELEKRHREAALQLRKLKVWQEEIRSQKENKENACQWGQMRKAINSVQKRFVQSNLR